MWLAAYGANSIEAFRQTRQIAASLPPDSRLKLVNQIIAHGSLSTSDMAHALPLLLIVLAVAAGGVRLVLNTARQLGSGEWRSSLICLCVVVFSQLALTEFVLPSSGGTNRQVVAVPFGLVCLAVAVSNGGRAARNGAVAVFVLLLGLQVSALSIYLSQLRNHWADRSSERFDKVVGEIRPEAKVVAVPEFWFAFRSHNRDLTVKSQENGYWAEVSNALEAYDVVILDREDYDSRLVERARESRPIERLIQSYPNRVFVLFARQGALLPRPENEDGSLQAR